MPEPIDWLPDGTPFSPRFQDRYHSETGQGLDQARAVFLAGCGLPAAWAGRERWCVLETGFGLGLNFLVTWAAWRDDPARPRLLHFVSCEAWPVAAEDLLRAAPQEPALQALARQLAAQCWGLLPGVHRLAFEGGRVLLTLCVGDAQALLRQQQPLADAVYLDGFSPARNPQLWSPHTLRAVARCCRRGTRLATWSVARTVRDGLAACGFVVQRVPGVAPKRENLQAVFDPAWQPRAGPPPLPHAAGPAGAPPGHCLVVGAGLAGAAVAESLARRGWQVTVLDAADAPAGGASGLPAGVFAPHVSPDDSVLSRLSRAGVRTTLQALARLAPHARGQDWDDTGVLEHGAGTPVRLAWSDGDGLDWSRPATPAQLRACHLPEDAPACWHARGGWVRPPQLVRHLLAQPGIRWQGGARVARLERSGSLWRALDGHGAVLAEAPLAVVCAGPASSALSPAPLPLQRLRGQIAWGLHAEAPPGAPWPAHPVNGHGNLVPRAPLGGPHGAPGWVLGSTFERGCDELPVRAADVQHGRAVNQGKLQGLLPALAQALAGAFATSGTTAPAGEEAAAPGAVPAPAADPATGPTADPAAAAPASSAVTAWAGGDGPVRTWAAVRCTSPDRLPLVGPANAQALPGLWLSTAMGARGLTLSLLCAELLAARLHGEPLPLDVRLARALGTERLQG